MEPRWANTPQAEWQLTPQEHEAWKYLEGLMDRLAQKQATSTDPEIVAYARDVAAAAHLVRGEILMDSQERALGYRDHKLGPPRKP